MLAASSTGSTSRHERHDVIRVDRAAVPAPPSLAIAGVKERDRAVELYDDPANCEASFTFRAYKGRDVVAALTALFHGKCAYCESSYAPVTPVDIEHFRPKGAIAIDTGGGRCKRSKPGYYWLAADWDNLLASCPDCNRARTHAFPDDAVTEVRGKENKFPLADESRRGRRPGEEATLELDQPLLLHPCRDQPERHLEFDPTGVVRGRPRSRKGATSVTALALGRSELNEARRAHLLCLARLMRGILWEIERLDDGGPDAAVEQKLALLLGELREATGDTAVYAGMSRQFIAAFERSIRERTVRAFVHDLFSRLA